MRPHNLDRPAIASGAVSADPASVPRAEIAVRPPRPRGKALDVKSIGVAQ